MLVVGLGLLWHSHANGLHNNTVMRVTNSVATTVKKVATPTSAQPVASTATSASSPKVTSAASTPQPSICQQNSDEHAVFVSLTQQHMWACSLTKQVYDTAVTTGAYKIDGDATPTGTWHILAKETNLYLTGPGYKDWVQYWMPFYSDYGFHDASWQTFNFGSPQYATDGSHGCVHLPTPAATWLYSWAPVGTTVTIQA